MLFGVDNPDPIDLDQIFTEDVNSRVLNCVLRQGYFPSVPTGDQNLERLKQLKRSYDSLGIASSLIPLLKEYKIAKDSIALAKGKLDRFKCNFNLTYILNYNYPELIPSIRDTHLHDYKDINRNHLNLLKILTSDNPKVISLGTLPSNEEQAIDKILETLGPDLDECDKYIESNFLAYLIKFDSDNPKFVALRLPPLDQIKDKEQAIDKIIDTFNDNDKDMSRLYNDFHKFAYFNNDKIRLISLIRRNRRNAKNAKILNDYENDIKNLREIRRLITWDYSDPKIMKIRSKALKLIKSLDNPEDHSFEDILTIFDELRETAAIVQSTKRFSRT